MLYLWKRNPKNAKGINHRKVRDHCHFTVKYRDAVHSIYNSKFKVLNEILVVFHNGSSYDYHFLIKENDNHNLANEFEVQIECLGESKEKYKTFSVLIKE